MIRILSALVFIIPKYRLSLPLSIKKHHLVKDLVFSNSSKTVVTGPRVPAPVRVIIVIGRSTRRTLKETGFIN